ncbi:hypothetical protein CGRA01v4_11391 [Colletotrichum graminicola]|nr:hypothetical protein CGRA01v4_11391 [Colletotrichum graminicola]
MLARRYTFIQYGGHSVAGALSLKLVHWSWTTS